MIETNNSVYPMPYTRSQLNQALVDVLVLARAGMAMPAAVREASMKCFMADARGEGVDIIREAQTDLSTRGALNFQPHPAKAR